MNEYGVTDEELHFPAGRFDATGSGSPAKIMENLDSMRRFPADLSGRVKHLSREKADSRTREGGWTVRQVVHHLADSHMNAFARCKFLLTDENPTILVADETAWALTPDAMTAPIEPSLHIIRNLYSRWLTLLDSLSASDYRRTYHHPKSGRDVPLSEAVALYAWHGRHHLAHIVRMLDAKGW